MFPMFVFVSLDVDKCASPPAPLNGDVQCSTDLAATATTCVVTCKPTFRFETPPAAAYRCTSDGTWTPPKQAIPNCILGKLEEFFFYLMTRTQHILFTVIWRERERNVLFNDALNTFYLRLYGERERNVLFNDALNTFYLRLYGEREKCFI